MLEIIKNFLRFLKKRQNKKNKKEVLDEAAKKFYAKKYKIPRRLFK